MAMARRSKTPSRLLPPPHLSSPLLSSPVSKLSDAVILEKGTIISLSWFSLCILLLKKVFLRNLLVLEVAEAEGRAVPTLAVGGTTRLLAWPLDLKVLPRYTRNAVIGNREVCCLAQESKRDRMVELWINSFS